MITADCLLWQGISPDDHLAVSQIVVHGPRPSGANPEIFTPVDRRGWRIRVDTPARRGSDAAGWQSADVAVVTRKGLTVGVVVIRGCRTHGARWGTDRSWATCRTTISRREHVVAPNAIQQIPAEGIYPTKNARRIRGLIGIIGSIAILAERGTAIR